MKIPGRRLAGSLRRRLKGQAPRRAPARIAASKGAVPDLSMYRNLDTPRLVRIPEIEVVAAWAADPRVVILMPHLAMARMTGGPNTILNLAGRLAGRGIGLRIAAVGGPADPDLGPLRAHAERLSETPLPPSLVAFAPTGDGIPLRIGPRDVLLATWWRTAHVARAALAQTDAAAFLYLVQDFEPGFYAWSPRHALALATYGFPHRAVVNERFLLDYLLGLGPGGFGGPDAAQHAISFEPAVDRTLFHPPAGGTGRAGRRRLLFYARPSNERNLFELGLRVLRDVAAAGLLPVERWEVLAIGAPMPELDLAPGVPLVPAPWLDYASYAALLRESDVLLSLMLSPHTSYPPLEMAACGHLVVTNEFGPKTAAALAARSPLLRAAPAEPAALAEALAAAIREAEGSVTPAPLDAPATWGEAFAPALTWLEATIRDVGGW